LHYAYSLNEGNTWIVERFLLEPAYEFEEAFHYRATLLKTSSNPHKYQIWYSAANHRHMHSIAHLAMMRQNGNLEPISASAHEELELAAPHRSSQVK
jgi:hypothetical protein